MNGYWEIIFLPSFLLWVHENGIVFFRLPLKAFSKIKKISHSLHKMLSLRIKKYDSLIQFFIIFVHLKPFIRNTAILIISHRIPIVVPHFYGTGLGIQWGQVRRFSNKNTLQYFNQINGQNDAFFVSRLIMNPPRSLRIFTLYLLLSLDVFAESSSSASWLLFWLLIKDRQRPSFINCLHNSGLALLFSFAIYSFEIYYKYFRYSNIN